ncbi:MAG: class I SAM-dependent methyltransferase [Streptomyces sp.]|uniref:class I SAM-dependent methyltransferase n=1 Tax=Streptomyces sp. TaxID=1931 RepID=UPI003D6AC413
MDRDAFAALLGDEGQALLASLDGYEPENELAVATRLRRDHPAELVSAALAQARLRQRAVAKFGAADAARMYFTPDGLEQATRASVAAYRAERFAWERGVRRLADLCCGVGGDAIALARAGVSVLAVDRDPLTCEVARANAGALGLADRIEVRCEDVGDVDISGYDAVFVDPARRGGKGRIFDPEAYSPPLSWAVEVARRVSHAALKVAPGIPHEAVPPDAGAEWISDGGEVKEAVLWFGEAGESGESGARAETPPVRATLLPGPHSLTSRGLPDPPPGPVGRYLYEPDGAVVRAHLVAEVARQLNGRLIDPTIAYVTGDEAHVTPYATGYEITDVLPFQLKRLRALLRERGVGVATIKKRGSAVEPAELRKKLKLEGPHACTVFLTRVAGAPTVLLGRPLARRTT